MGQTYAKPRDGTGAWTLGWSITRDGWSRVLSYPASAMLSLFALTMTLILSPIWGLAFGTMGWLDARAHLTEEGPIALGRVLAPAAARAQFRDGIFKGLWRVHKLSAASLGLHLGPATLTLLPAAALYYLMWPAARQVPYPAASFALLFPAGVAGITALMLVLHALLLSYRHLAEVPSHRLGTAFAAVGRAWRQALTDRAAVFGSTLLLVVTAVAIGALVFANIWIAGRLEVAPGIVQLWASLIGAALFAAVALEVVSQWADTQSLRPPLAEDGFSVSAWFTSWVADLGQWLNQRSTVELGVALCVLGGAAALALFGMEGQLTESWVALGWFVATTGTLALMWHDRRKA